MKVLEIGRVVALEKTKVWVETIRTSACGSCAARSGCGHRTLAGALTSDKGLVRVGESESLRAGACSVNDRVEISIPRTTLSSGALLLYGSPLAAGIGVAAILSPAHDLVIAAGFFGGLFAAFLALKWLSARELFGNVEPRFERLVEINVGDSPVPVEVS